MDAPVSRRRLLWGAAAGGAALAGCGDPPRRTSRAVLVTNATGAEFTVTVRIYDLPEGAVAETRTATPTERSSGDGTDGETDAGTVTDGGLRPPTDELEEVLVDRETLAPEEGFGIPGGGLPDGPLRVRVTTTGGQSDSHDWARVDERSTLDARVGENTVRFTELD